MLTMPERNAFIILTLVAFTLLIGALVMESLGTESFAIRFSPKTQEGTLVFISGVIEKQTIISDGGHRILVINGTTVFIPGSVGAGLSLSRGQSVTIYGLVTTYQGEKEITVQRPGDIHAT
ncbi:MAG TPA: hypothetical protein VMS89_07105 [Methanoregulaceae archaeon]|nr:hypothetical protein [Methanoregulaceae archaeon]